jgi:antitoxin VapB
MTKEYKAKVFKSGNSLALRLPKALGLKEGSTMVLREERQGFTVEPEDAPKRKFNIDKVWRSATNLKPVDPDDRWFEERPLNWGDAKNAGQA